MFVFFFLFLVNAQSAQIALFYGVKILKDLGYINTFIEDNHPFRASNITYEYENISYTSTLFTNKYTTSM